MDFSVAKDKKYAGKKLIADPYELVGLDSWAEDVYNMFIQNAPIEDEEEDKDSSCQENNPE